jgi:hypothetical protein
MLPEIDELSFSRESSSWKFYLFAVSRAGPFLGIKSHRTKLGTRSGIGNQFGFWILPFTKSVKQYYMEGRKHLLLFVVPNVRKVEEPGV